MTAITNPNLDDKSIKRKLAQKSLHGMDLINKINNELYNEKLTNQESIVKAKKILNKEDSNNPNKIKKEKEDRLGTVLFHTDAGVLYRPFFFIQRMLLSEILFIAP